MIASCDKPGLLSIEDAKSRITEAVRCVTETETIRLEQSLERVLAEDVYSPINVPGFDNASMDGYAFRVQDLIDLGALRVVGKSFAGNAYPKPLASGECVRIMTGAAVPEGADAVMMQENAVLKDGNVSFTQIPDIGNDIRLAGENIKQNSLVGHKGKRITAADIGLLSSLGCENVKVYRKIKVAIFSTGDELLRTGEDYQQHKIYDGNRPSIIALLQKMNCDVIDFGIVGDDKDELRKTVLQADTQADCVITSGGASVGEADFIKDILAELGEVDFWKIAIKPGKPLAFGRLPNSLFFGLPGNPVSAFVTFNQIAAHALKQLAGERYKPPHVPPAKSTGVLMKQPGRVDYQRGRCYLNDDGQLLVESTGPQGSGVFSSFSNSNCFIVLERERGRVQEGETVHIQLFDPTLL
jgi:molybdopterin molybdotransferase